MDRFPEPTQAKQFLKRKRNVETDEWDELKWGEHAHAFTVAHSVKANILDDIHGLLNQAMAEGRSFQDFRKGLLDAMDKRGWYGREDKGKDDKAYINWRIKVIYNANMRTAYSAAQYRDNLENAEARPIWVYKSKLVGKNRRQEHIALHNKGFRYDDPFWNVYYPPNGWECKCRVTTKSEHGAKRDGIDVLKSDKDGNPPTVIDKSGKAVDWKKAVDQTWKYNVGREALAPNFNKFENLKKYEERHGITLKPGEKSVWEQVVDAYRQDMNNTRLTQGEFITLLKRMNKRDYMPDDKSTILYQVGNLAEKPHKALMERFIEDSKIMSTDYRLWHGSGDKNKAQEVPEDRYIEVYQMLQNPDEIYENTDPEYPHLGREIHFVKDWSKGKKFKIVLRTRDNVSLHIVTMGIVDERDYEKDRYEIVQ
jgi:hypothetical protein